jgi:hypothetical protein
MLKQLLLATVLLGACSSDARAHGHRHSHARVGRHAYHGLQVNRHRLDQSLLSQRHKNQPQYAHPRAEISARRDATTPFAPKLSGSVITASPGFIDGYWRNSYPHRDRQRLADQTSADQHRLLRHRFARAWCGAYLSAHLGKTDRRLSLAREGAREAPTPAVRASAWSSCGRITSASSPLRRRTGNGSSTAETIGAPSARGRARCGVIAFRRV